MNTFTKRLLLSGIMLSTLCACGKKDDAAQDEARTESKAQGNVVVLSEESLKNIDIETEEVNPGPLGRKLKVPARITSDMNRTAKVSSMLEGRILKLSKDLGDKVSQGEELGLLEAPELLDKPLILRAPIAGILTEKSATVGEWVGKGQEIYALGDPGRLWLIGEVRENDLALVRQGLNVNFTVPAYPGEVFHGKIAKVANAVETDSRTFEVRVEIENTREKLKPGMFADMEITTEILNNALVISDAALQTEDDGQIVFVALDRNRFEKRAVKIGRKAEGRVHILEGIREGERIVTEGSFTLKSEMLKGELGEE